MSDILIHPTYFPNIAHFSAMVQADTVTFEWDDNFQKQTYRNRCYVYGANGKVWNETVSGENRRLGDANFSYRLRDIFMVSQADVVYAIWDGKSSGTLQLYNDALNCGRKAYITKCPR